MGMGTLLLLLLLLLLFTLASSRAPSPASATFYFLHYDQVYTSNPTYSPVVDAFSLRDGGSNAFPSLTPTTPWNSAPPPDLELTLSVAMDSLTTHALYITNASKTLTFPAAVNVSVFAVSCSFESLFDAGLHFSGLPPYVAPWIVPTFVSFPHGVSGSTRLNLTVNASALSPRDRFALALGPDGSPGREVFACAQVSVNAPRTHDAYEVVKDYFIVRVNLTATNTTACPPGSFNAATGLVPCELCPSDGHYANPSLHDPKQCSVGRLPCTTDSAWFCGDGAVAGADGTYHQRFLAPNMSISTTTLSDTTRAFELRFNNTDALEPFEVALVGELPLIVQNVIVHQHYEVQGGKVLEPNGTVRIPPRTSGRLIILVGAPPGSNSSVAVSYSDELTLQWMSNALGDRLQPVLQGTFVRIPISLTVVSAVVWPDSFSYQLDANASYSSSALNPDGVLNVYNPFCNLDMHFVLLPGCLPVGSALVFSTNATVHGGVFVRAWNLSVSVPPTPVPSWFAWSGPDIAFNGSDRVMAQGTGQAASLPFTLDLNLTSNPALASVDPYQDAPTLSFCFTVLTMPETPAGIQGALSSQGLGGGSASQTQIISKSITVSVQPLGPCPPGSYSKTGKTGTGCFKCPRNQYQPYSERNLCLDCPPTTPVTMDYGATSADQCTVRSGSFLGINGSPSQCVVGANCSLDGYTYKTLPLVSGYWRTGPTSLNIMACSLRPQYCVGGAFPANWAGDADNATSPLCAQGHHGIFCFKCVEGLVMRGTSRLCSACDPHAASSDDGRVTGIIVGVSLGIILLAAVVVWRVWHAYKKRRLEPRVLQPQRSQVDRFLDAVDVTIQVRIILGLIQVVGSMTVTFSNELPSFFQQVSNVFKLFSLDLVSVLDFGCSLHRQDHMVSLLFVTLLPAGLCAVVGVCYWLLDRHLVRGDAELRDEVRLMSFTTFLFILFLGYPSISSTVLLTFSCVHYDNGAVVLMTDPSVSCLTPDYNSYAAYAGINVFVYVVGVPFVYSYLLFTRRKYLDPHTDQGNEQIALAVRERDRRVGSIRFLWRPAYFWWEVYELIRKLLQTSIVAFFATGSSVQILFQLLVTGIAVTALHSFRPYVERRNLVLALATQWVVFGIAFCSLLIRIAKQVAAGGNGFTLDLDLGMLNGVQIALFLFIPVLAVLQIGAELLNHSTYRFIFFCVDWDRIEAKSAERLKNMQGSVRSFAERSRASHNYFFCFLWWWCPPARGGDADDVAGAHLDSDAVASDGSARQHAVVHAAADESDVESARAAKLGRPPSEPVDKRVAALSKNDWRGSFIARHISYQRHQKGAAAAVADGDVDKLREHFLSIQADLESTLDRREAEANLLREQAAGLHDRIAQLAAENMAVRSKLAEVEAATGRAAEDAAAETQALRAQVAQLQAQLVDALGNKPKRSGSVVAVLRKYSSTTRTTAPLQGGDAAALDMTSPVWRAELEQLGVSPAAAAVHLAARGGGGGGGSDLGVGRPPLSPRAAAAGAQGAGAFSTSLRGLAGSSPASPRGSALGGGAVAPVTASAPDAAHAGGAGPVSRAARLLRRATDGAAGHSGQGSSPNATQGPEPPY